MDWRMVNVMNLPSILKPFTCKNLMRLGKDHDGGYLVNELDVKRTDHLIGFGIGTDISFENDFVKINECDVNLYDKNIDIPINNHYKVFRQNIIHDISLQDIFKDKHKVFLKCDIEGDEYLLCDFLINNSHLFTGLVVEFHDIHNYKNFDKLTNFIGKFSLPLVHTHVNNHFYIKVDSKNIPSVVELSFSSSDNLAYDANIKLPHKLDMRNKIDEIDFYIQFDGDM